MSSKLYLRTCFLLVITLLSYFSYAQDTLTYRSALTGRSEVMPVLTGATGTMQIQIVGNQLIVSGEFNGLSSTLASDGINIHAAYAGQTGDAVFGLIPNLSPDLRSGQIDATLNTFTLNQTQIDAFTTRQFYINIATTEHPSGEIRGQIVREGITYFYANAYGSNHTHSVLSRGHASAFVEVVSSSQMVVTGSFNNLESSLTAAHLYVGTPGQDGTQIIELTPTTVDQETGTFEVSNNIFNIDLDLIIALGERRIYLNILTTEYPEGELRGQLVPAEAGVVFRTNLSGTNVVPNTLTQASGHLLAEVYGDSLMILSGTYENLSSPLRDDPLSKTGIFAGIAGSNGDETLALNPTASSSTGGAIEATRNIYFLFDEESDLLFSRNLNVVIASENYPDGEIRGQFIPEAQVVLTGFFAGAFQAPPVHSGGSGNSIAELRGDELIISGSFHDLEESFATNSGISSALAGSTGAAQFPLMVTTSNNELDGNFTNSYTLSTTQIDDLLARRFYMSIASGAASTPELRAQLLPEANAYFVATLSGASEVPVLNSASLGQAIVEVHQDKAVLSGSFKDLESDFNPGIGAHIHNGLAGQNGGVNNALITDIGNNNRSGSFQAVNNEFNLTETQLANLFAREQYVNVHSIDNQSGAIRGQLLPLASAYFTSTLAGSNTVIPLESTGTGSVKFDLIGNVLTVSGSHATLNGAATDNGATLNIGAAGVNGAAIFTLTSVADGTGGTLLAADNQFVLTAEQVEAVRNEMLYISVVSEFEPGGEVRGQVLTEPNFFPSGNMRFTRPIDGEFFVAEGDPTARFTAEWAEGIDNNNLYYIYQTSEFLDFREIDEEFVLTDAPGSFEYNLGELDTFLMMRGLAVGDTISRYYRMVASDGSLNTIGDGNFITMVRGDVRPVAGADIEISITGPTGVYEVFSEIPYEITVVNNGPLNARDITIDLRQPDDMVYTRSSATVGRYNLFFENWKIDNLASGDTAVMNLTLFTLTDERPIDFFIEVQGSLPSDPDSRPFNGIAPTPQEDDEAVFTIYPTPRPIGGDTSDLRLDILIEEEEFEAFANATFRLVVTNDGPDPAANIRVSALFPEGMVFTNAEASQGEYNVVAQDWYIPLIENGASDTLALTLFSLIEGQPLILFSQIIASDQFDPDSTPANDLDNVPDEDDEASSIITPVGGIQGGVESDLELTVEIDRPEYERYVDYTYTFTLTNNGPDDASNIFVDAQLPDSLAYTSKAASIGDWNNFFQYWFIPYLPSGEKHTLKLVLFSLAAEIDIDYFTQILSVDQSDPDSAPGNNQTGIPVEDDESSVRLSPSTDSGLQNGQIQTLASSPSIQATLYPSPAQNRVYLDLQAEYEQVVEVQLLNINGKLLERQAESVEKGLNQLEFNVTALPEGIYYLGVMDKEGQQRTWKFVKVAE